MTTTIVNQYSSNSGNPSVSDTPVAGDELWLAIIGNRTTPRTVSSVSGCGATWAEAWNSGGATPRLVVWRGTGPNASGTVTVTLSGAQTDVKAVWLVRDLSAPTVTAGFTTTTGTTLAGPSDTVTNGQAALATTIGSSTPITFPDSPSPATGWVSSLATSTGIAYRTPSSSATHQVSTGQPASALVYLAQVVLGNEVAGDQSFSIPTMTATATMHAPAVSFSGLTFAVPTMTATATMHAPTIGVASNSRPTVQHDSLPLTVRIGDRHITREVSALAFRKEATGGLRSVSLRLSRPLDRFDPNLAALSKVYVYDGRSGATVAEGRLSDFGRSAGSDGQQWDLVAFGPAQHAADKTQPLIYVDQRLDVWRRHFESTKNATTQTDERGEDTPTLLVAAEQGKTISTSWVGAWVYRPIRRAGMKLARVVCDWDAGVDDADYQVVLFTHVGDAAASGVVDSDGLGSGTGGGGLVGKLGDANFNNGDDVCDLRMRRNTSSTTGAEAHWAEFYNIKVLSRLMDKDGTNITSGYTNGYVLAHEIVKDLLGRVLDQFDGTNATVATTGTYQVDQAAYPDGVTAEQVLSDLAILEPAYVWYAKEDITGDGYQFFYELLPTTVRYEVTLDDGGSFPISWQEVYNKCTVNWTDKDGRPRTTTVTSTVEEFDNATPPIVRSTNVDLGDEVGSSAAATRAGDNFLAEHNVPKNAGSLNISRPIRDLELGRMVMPFEIEPRELIRVRGVESSPDALNASSNDGQTVFRIHALTYTSESGTASLELDTDSRSTTNALRKALRRRHRKR